MNAPGGAWLEPATPGQRDRGRLIAVTPEESLFGLTRSLLAPLWRWRLLILAIVAAGIAAAWVAVSTIPSTYIARAEVFFDFSRQSVVSDLPAEALAPSAAMLNTEMEILTSRNLMRVVAEELNLTEDPEFNPWLPATGEAEAGAEAIPDEEEVLTTAVSILLGQVDVSLVPDSYVFSITVETLSPEKSASIANGIADIFIRERDRRRLDAFEDAIAWLERRAGSLRQRVLESENRVAEERALAAPGGLDSLTTMAAQIASLNERLTRAKADADRLEAAAGRVRSDWESGKLVAAVELAIEGVSGQLGQQLDAAMDVAPDSDRIQRLEPLVQEAQSQIAEAGASARAEARDLQTAITGLRAVYSVRTAEVQKLRDSEREAAASLAAYETMLNRLKGRAAADALDPFWPEAEVISPAVVPAFAASPDRELILALGGVGSLVLASGVALLLNALFPVVASAHDLERTTGTPVVAQIPLPSRSRLPKLQEQLRRRASSPLADGLRALMFAIALESRETAARIILLTSADKGEGTRAVGYLLAQAFAQAGRKVLLIDANPAATEASGLERTELGLNSVLLGKVDPSESIIQDSTSGFAVLLAPEALRDSAGLPSYDEARAGLRRIASDYDVAIMVAPPVGRLPDARILARLSDAVVVVVRRHASRPAAVADAVQLLVSSGASRVATVLLSRRGR